MTSTSTSRSKIPVFLLKTRSQPADGYEECFSGAGEGQFLPIFVPVLEHQFQNNSLLQIRHLILRGGLHSEDPPHAPRYGGIIFTSQRAVEAFSKVVQEIKCQPQLDLDVLLPETCPLYVVGPATARALRALKLRCPILGEETGNGEALAAFILEHYNQQESTRAVNPDKPPLLFLVGEQRRDMIPKTLQSEALETTERIGVEEWTVYETKEKESFGSSFASLLTETEIEGGRVRWAVVFSPTGCKAMLTVLGLLDPNSGKVIGGSEGSRAHSQQASTFVATIGPTTRDYLLQEFAFQPHVCAEQPSPAGVRRAIEAFMSSMDP
ncbi:uroporphyrinogen-III synthase-like protein [Trichodelitschia bisporula]|uniref:Uroporphyrinogen-III synthase-like protein n=1 Tax=Trichodelitschia bisporula TaxID=703511 RepID=A0A6G1I2G8_9PEZI|nr:uroporphyrinogen-III synthase-like protein [Trichodelitschia bisporula]